MINDDRNKIGLNERTIQNCIVAWEVLGGNQFCELDTSFAHIHSSQTKFIQNQNKVILGADVLPGNGTSAHSRISLLACLAHEKAHAERFNSFRLDRDVEERDEAETNIHASWEVVLSPVDKESLIAASVELLEIWLENKRN
ncbi:MAG: hypothetical protein AB7I41_03110 [Candidatus Sericytochromatia bacterium]